MNKVITAVIAILSVFALHGQEKNNQISGRFDPASSEVKEALVNMAMQNPQIKSLINTSLQAEYDYRRTKSTAWLNNITIAGNLNEFSIKRDNSDPLRQSTQYPRYNIGLRLPLGMFAGNGKQIKADYYKYQSTVEDVEVEKASIRLEVLTAYESYLMNKELFDLQEDFMPDQEILIKKMEEKFSKNEISFENYATATKAYNAERSKSITLRNALNVSIVKVESLIGMKLRDALQMLSVQNKK